MSWGETFNVGGRVASGGGSGLITPSVTVSRTSGKAPLSILFDASATTGSTSSNPEHEYFYAWDFGDDTGITYTYGKDTSQNLNVAYGVQAGHTYLSNDTFSWSCLVLDGSGNINSTGGTITVSAWTEAETVYIANGATPTAGSNGVGSGASSYNNATSWSALEAILQANKTKRIRLRAGDTWLTTTVTYITGIVGMQIDAYGVGAAPNLDSTFGANTYCSILDITGSDMRVCNIKMTANTADAVGANGINIRNGSDHVLLYGIESTGAHQPFGSTDSTNISIDKCNIHDIGTTNVSGGAAGTFYYGMYLDNCYNGLAIRNTRCENVVTGHGIRVPGVSKGSFTNNTLLKARAGYGGGSGHVLTIRGFTNAGSLGTWTGLWTEKVVVSGNVIGSNTDGGLDFLHIASQNTSDASRHRNIIVENNVLKGDTSTVLNTEVSSNMTIRNNIFIQRSGIYAITVQGISAVGAPLPSDTKIYNNTFWKYEKTPDPNGWSAIYFTGGTGATTGTDIKNNLIYAPLDVRDANQGGSTPTMLAMTGTTSTYTESNNSSSAQIKGTKPWTAATPSAYTDFAPDSYGINGGASVPIVKDFFNQTITGAREIGAIQV